MDGYEIVQCAVKYYVIYKDEYNCIGQVGPFVSYAEAEENSLDYENAIVSRQLEEI